MNEWSKACIEFRHYQSLVEDQLDLIQKGHLVETEWLRHFAITYLEMDPMYFRSGYIKGMLLQKLKAVKFDNSETARLTAVLIDAIRNRGQREFRRYCRLAAVMQRPEVLEEAVRLSESPDGRVASRAKMMLRYIDDARRQHRE